MRIMPFMKRKNGVQFAGVGLDTGISTLANKTDLTAIIMTGTTNTSGSTITAGTWFYLNGKLVKAKVDIASNVTFTKDTNYEEKTIGEELIELNSNMIYNRTLFFDSSISSTDIQFPTSGLFEVCVRCAISAHTSLSDVYYVDLQSNGSRINKIVDSNLSTIENKEGANVTVTLTITGPHSYGTDVRMFQLV